MQIVFTIVEFAIVLGIMVLVHEFGHFAVAKLCGVRVETFSIGFGPRLFGWRSGDTDYRVSLLPLGGYVKMAGEMPDGERTEAGNDDEFGAQPRWQRILIALSGPFSNFILAFFLLLMVALFHHEVDVYLNGPAVVDYVPLNSPAAHLGMATGDTIVRFGPDTNPDWEQVLDDCVLNLNHDVPVTFTHSGQTISGDLHILPGAMEDGEISPDFLAAATGIIPRKGPGPVGVSTVSPGTPAERAGLQGGDQIVKIDTVEAHSVQTLLAYLQDRNGAPASLLVLRSGKSLTIPVTPERLDNGAGDVRFRLGFSNALLPEKVEKLSFSDAVSQAIKDTHTASKMIFRVLKGMFTGHVSVRSLSGPVGIAQQVGMAWSLGTWTLLTFMATISLNLGIFNLLPIPLLDGGMIVFLLIESVIRRDLNQTAKERVYQVAFFCLILFAGFVLFNDITKLHMMHH